MALRIRFRGGGAELLAILADEPNYPRASQVLGEVCTLQGRFDEGIEYAQRARQERAAAERITLATSRRPFPGLGRIERSGAGWRWEPLKSDGRTTP